MATITATTITTTAALQAQLSQYLQGRLVNHEKFIETLYATLLFQRPLMAVIFFPSTGVGIWLLTSPSVPLLTLASASFCVYVIINEGLTWAETTHKELLENFLRPVYSALQQESSLPSQVKYSEICGNIAALYVNGKHVFSHLSTLKESYPTLYLPTVCAVSFYLAVIGLKLTATTLAYIIVYGISLMPAIYHYRFGQSLESMITSDHVDENAIPKLPFYSSRNTSTKAESSPVNQFPRKRRGQKSTSSGSSSSRVPILQPLPSSQSQTEENRLEPFHLSEAVSSDETAKQQTLSLPSQQATDSNSSPADSVLSESGCDDEWEKVDEHPDP